jgi:hypothetical protein
MILGFTPGLLRSPYAGATNTASSLYPIMAYSFTYRWSVWREIPSILHISATEVLVSA